MNTVNTAMRFEKRNFMGIQLDVLVGHPDHDLLFIAKQVGEAAGLVDARQHLRKIAAKMTHLRVSEAIGANQAPVRPEGIHAPTWPKMFLFPEDTVYQMLLRGHAPASEPFRKWVTEEVLPTIRKTGSYNAETSTNPIAQGVMDELKLLREEVGSLRGLIEMLAQAKPVVSVAPVSVMPTESAFVSLEIPTATVWFHFDRKMLISSSVRQLESHH